VIDSWVEFVYGDAPSIKETEIGVPLVSYLTNAVTSVDELSIFDRMVREGFGVVLLTAAYALI
jgi:hypothetical protein